MRSHHGRSGPPSDEGDGRDISGLDEESFDALEDAVDRAAAQGRGEGEPTPHHGRQNPSRPIRTEQDFEEAVRSAIDELPDQFRQALKGVVVVVSDDGHKQHAYGMYVGHTAGYEFSLGRPESYALPDEIVIYRDTLTRDFGGDPARLRAEIARTVRHEVAHHFGFSEPGVHGLGL